MRPRSIRAHGSALFLALVVAGHPGAAPAQGLFINPFEERAMGVAQYQPTVAENGGRHPNTAFAAYVNEMGMRVARTSARHPDEFVFTTLNSSQFNAFNSLGGFVFVYAGILPWINDESELAALLGHEVGHAINRHVAHNINRQSVSERLIALSVLRGRGSSAIQDKQVRAKLMLLQFGRDQEYEADDVAYRATSALNLDRRGAARMLFALVLHTAFVKTALGDKYQEGPAILENHPSSIERVRRSLGLADEAGPEDSPVRNRDRFLDMIDGFTVPPDAYTAGKPTRVKVVRVQPGQTAEQLAKQMQTYPRLQLPLFLSINGMTDPADLKRGERVKLLVAR